jgi:hypothetical protein
MKIVVTEVQVIRAWSTFFEAFDLAKYRAGKTGPLPHMRAALEDFAQTLGEPVAVPDAMTVLDGRDPIISGHTDSAYAMGWNACREAMLTPQRDGG